MSGATMAISDAGDPIQVFWSYVRRRELRLPACGACGVVRAHLDRWCTGCGHEGMHWQMLSGRGAVWSHCVFHKAPFKAFATPAPYNVVLVKLDEGPLFIGNVVGTDNSAIEIGMRLEAVFGDSTTDAPALSFRAAVP